MSVTPQTNITLAELAVFLRDHDDFCICGHVSPDGDCLGSQLSLAHALELSANALCASSPATRRLMPGLHHFPVHATLSGPVSSSAPQCFVAVDVPTRERLGDASRLLDGSAASATVDHHAVDDRMTDICYTDPDSASTSLLVWELIGYLGVEPSADMATCAFAVS